MILDASAPAIAETARQANLAKDREQRADLGQFLTPAAVASQMAGMFAALPATVRLLDPGAGSGALTAAFVAEAVRRDRRPGSIEATCYEIDSGQRAGLESTLAGCRSMAAQAGIEFTATVRDDDFILSGVGEGKAGCAPRYDAVIMNPPYRKIGAASRERHALRSVGIETVNLYAGFMALATLLLAEGGQLIAITPRSFCNGPYYRPFRQLFLTSMSLRRIHVFASRSSAFGDDAVLQENIITAAVRGVERGQVAITESCAGGGMQSRLGRYDEVVRPDDPESFIRIRTDEAADEVAGLLSTLPGRISDLGLTVSTGPVVDFRLRDHLVDRPQPLAVPLLWPCNCRNGATVHPVIGRKPQWIMQASATRRWLTPNERFVLVKRFSAKEERRRVVAVVHDPQSVDGSLIALENHVNYIHGEGHGLAPALAAGLAAYLNSGLVDAYFRQFNGHTQVNATDLRSLPCPTRGELESLGGEAQDDVADPGRGDHLIRRIAAAARSRGA